MHGGQTGSFTGGIRAVRVTAGSLKDASSGVRALNCKSGPLKSS